MSGKADRQRKMNPILPRKHFVPDGVARVMPDGWLYQYDSMTLAEKKVTAVMCSMFFLRKIWWNGQIMECALGAAICPGRIMDRSFMRRIVYTEMENTICISV